VLRSGCSSEHPVRRGARRAQGPCRQDGRVAARSLATGQAQRPLRNSSRVWKGRIGVEPLASCSRTL